MDILPPLLAEMGAIEKYVITGLAVAGGFLVGFVLTNLIARGLCKFVFHKKPPENLIRIARFAGGVAVAILVFCLISGDGGFGGGGGGGNPLASTKGDNTKENQPKDEEKRDPKIVPKPKDKKENLLEAINIYVLPSNGPGDILYRIESQEESLNLKGVLDWVDDRQKSGTPVKLVRIDGLRKDGKVLPNFASDGRRQLQKKLKEKEIEVTLPEIE